MFEYTVRVYFSDTDAGGIVYHTHYLDWAEHARTEILRSILPDFGQNSLKDAGYLFVVKSINIDYKRPALLDDEILITTEVEKLERFSGTFLQRVLRGEDELCEIHTKVGFISKETMKIAILPDEIRDKLKSI